MKLVLENNEGQAVRTFLIEGDSAVVIQRKDTRRLEVHTSLARLEKAKTKFEQLGEFSRASIASAPLAIRDHGRLRVVAEGENADRAVLRDEEMESDDQKTWWTSFGSMILLALAFFTFLQQRSEAEDRAADEARARSDR